MLGWVGLCIVHATKGEVEVRIESLVDGKMTEKVVNRHYPGDCFGEQALLTKGKRIASCVATKACSVRAALFVLPVLALSLLFTCMVFGGVLMY